MKKLLITAFATTLLSCVIGCNAGDNTDTTSSQPPAAIVFDPTHIQLGVGEHAYVTAYVSHSEMLESGTVLSVDFFATADNKLLISPESCELSAPDYNCIINVYKQNYAESNVYVVPVSQTAVAGLAASVLVVESAE